MFLTTINGDFPAMLDDNGRDFFLNGMGTQQPSVPGASPSRRNWLPGHTKTQGCFIGYCRVLEFSWEILCFWEEHGGTI